MKAQKFLSAPYLMIAIFLFIIISGEHWGGFYLIYLLLALPHAGVHALFAIGGILVLVLTHNQLNWAMHRVLKLVGCFIGVCLLAASLYSFFRNDTSGYNDSSFEQAVPLGSIILTIFLALVYLGLNLSLYVKSSRLNGAQGLNSR